MVTDFSGKIKHYKESINYTEIQQNKPRQNGVAEKELKIKLNCPVDSVKVTDPN